MAAKKKTFAVTRFFFDKPVVRNSLERKFARVLGHLGGIIRKIAKRSIRTRKRPSDPGSPPSNHTGLLRNNIFYSYDPESTSVVIGPAKLNQLSYVFVGGGEGRRFIAGAAPSILERGGVIGIREVKNTLSGTWERISWRKKLAEILVPVWLASAKEKANSIGIKTVYNQKRAINFYRVPRTSVSRIRYAKIAPRPYMAPAILKAKESYHAAWDAVGNSLARGGE